MNLGKKKQLAAEVLNVGKNKIKFASDKLPEIKEAITKQDIRELYKEGFISIKTTIGKRKRIKRKTRIGPGNIRTKVKHRKRDYVRITRKLRGYLKELLKQGKIDSETYRDSRKKIKMRYFKSKSYLKEYLTANKEIKKDNIEIEVKTKKQKKSTEKKERSSKPKGVKKK
ncbi:MAG: 50S ribosomal protein L19e [Candidatus Nanoarchaeia archaeon]|nr:50S ribosomal protein L19e [Candidatus Nanoarchaeia archaeon]MDD5741728.1 50S ribosomal protein L19e [Candidatus Nanoarchaeia archaeon]